MSCRQHGVVFSSVPWARHGSRFTRSFEDQVAWLAVNTPKTAVAAGVVIDHDGEVAMLLAVADLVDPDPSDPIEQIHLRPAFVSTRSRMRPPGATSRPPTSRVTLSIAQLALRTSASASPWATRIVRAFLDALGQEGCKQLKLISADGGR